MGLAAKRSSSSGRPNQTALDAAGDLSNLLGARGRSLKGAFGSPPGPPGSHLCDLRVSRPRFATRLMKTLSAMGVAVPPVGTEAPSLLGKPWVAGHTGEQLQLPDVNTVVRRVLRVDAERVVGDSAPNAGTAGPGV